MAGVKKKYALAMLISGGQTGVDRIALDFAMQAGIAHAGWCPLGRRAEDGEIPKKYCLREASTPLYQQRTRLNVRDSQATLIFSDQRRQSRGTALTVKYAVQLAKPFIVVDVDNVDRLAVLKWLRRVKPQILNVAGPRAGESSRAVEVALQLLLEIICADTEKAVCWPPPKPTTPDLF
jgi:ADP-ribose pyrophosphatase YjhB (NUDIX family)